MVQVSILVLNYNGASMLREALESLLQINFGPYEVIVVDNGSQDDSLAVASEFDVRVIETGANLGFSKANNLGVDAAEGDYVLFVNNDMRFDREFVTPLVEVLDGDPTIFAVDSKQFDWEGHQPIHGARRWERGSPIEAFWPFRREVQLFDPAGPTFTPWGCASNLMVRKWMFEELGGFDPTFFLDYEDLDLCWRAWMRGWGTVFVPRSLTYHDVGKGSSNVTTPRTLWRGISGEKNVERFFLKTMPSRILLQIAFGRVLRSLGAIFSLRLGYLGVLAPAVLATIGSLPDILRERRAIQASAAVRSDEIISTFGTIGRGQYVADLTVKEPKLLDNITSNSGLDSSQE